MKRIDFKKLAYLFLLFFCFHMFLSMVVKLRAPMSTLAISYDVTNVLSLGLFGYGVVYSLRRTRG